MAVVRRLYLYAMSGITLAVLAAGLQLLLDILFGQLGVGRGGTVFKRRRLWHCEDRG